MSQIDLTPSDEELCEIIEKAITSFKGNSEVLRGAIGYLFLARRMGWKPSLLMNTQQTVKQYDRILNIDSRVLFVEVGVDAKKSIAWATVQTVSNFWKAVKGEIKGVRSTQISD